jgi:hypothetical protein
MPFVLMKMPACPREKFRTKEALAAWWLSARNRMKELMLRLSEVSRAGAIEPFATPEQLHWGCEIF